MSEFPRQFEDELIEKKSNYLDRLVNAGLIESEDEANIIEPYLKKADKQFEKLDIEVNPDIYQMGYGSVEFNQLFKKEINSRIKDDGIKNYFEQFCDTDYVKNSIDDIADFPDEYWIKYPDPKEVFYSLNNFYMRFDGRSPRQFLTPSLIRLSYAFPEVVKKVSNTVKNYRDFLELRTPESLAFYQAYKASLEVKNYTGRNFYQVRNAPEIVNLKNEKLYNNIGDDLNLLDAYNKITKLVDRNDLDYREQYKWTIQEKVDAGINRGIESKQTLKGYFFV